MIFHFVLSLHCVNPSIGKSQEAVGDYADGFQNGMSPRLEYQRIRRLWVDVEPIEGGLLVTGLYPNSPARRIRSPDGKIKGVSLEPDDVILSINRNAALTSQDLANGISNSGQFCELVVKDHRSGQNQIWLAEPIWANVPILRSRSSVSADVEEHPSKLHAIVVAATNDPSLGPFIERSLAELQAQFSGNMDSNRLDLKILSGDDCNATQLVETLEELSSDVNDSLLVYYLGHGAYDPRFDQHDPYGGHFLDLPGKDLLRKTVWDHMESAYAQFRVLVTDSCNVESVADPDSRLAFETRMVQRTVMGSTPLEWLFLGHRGRCDIGAASKGQFAWYSKDLGGWFTNRWIATSSKSQSWTDVKDRIIPATEELYAIKKREYMSDPATTQPNVMTQLAQQEKMTPQILLTRVKREAVDPIGIDKQRTLTSTVTSSVRVP